MSLIKPRLIILSDLFGFDNSPWIEDYKGLLKSGFQLTFYNAHELAGIDKTTLTEEEIHSQFINGGIENAVNKLLELEKEEVSVLAFSIGGTIAWKAALQGFNVNNLLAVSSTRLRYELKEPDCNIQLYFGGKDLFIPKDSWFENLNLKAEIIENELHEVYKTSDFTQDLCEKIIKTIAVSN